VIVSQSPVAVGPPRNPLLLPQIGDPLLAQVLERPSRGLAEATRPNFVQNPRSPVQWTGADFDKMEDSREPLLEWPSVLSQFNAEAFLRDGACILERVMTPAAIEAWSEALLQGQQCNDRLISGDWTQIDWAGLGRTPPNTAVTKADREKALGGSQTMPQSDDEAGVQTLRQHSVFAEYFSAGHVGFLMNVMTHPQMLDLQRLCLKAETVYFDHNQLLTRAPGYAGGAWHSHKIGAGNDDGVTVADLDAYRRQPNINLTLCYPQGFSADADGGLKLVSGSHLFRDPAGCRAPDDDALRAGWLKDRRHPVTGRALEIEHLALPPGSIVCCLSHAAHAVAPKAQDRSTRWCSLFCYRKADEENGIVQPPHAVPPVWSLKAQRGELPATLTQLVQHSFDRELTGGRVGTFDQ